ncbi:MAG TPA: amidohydrolase family protein [Anaerolineaceae bacterium]|nr:amidohydrolase family protein [Anaerolineaceae bacterium]
MIRIPGLIDPHVHLREPGGVHKEDWDSGTQAALAGGVTLLLAMPNTRPPVTDKAVLETALEAAAQKARVDYAQYLGAGPGNARSAAGLAPRAAGLKMYLDQTFGDLRLDDVGLWMEHFASWPRNRPIAAHAEGPHLAAVILLAVLFDRPVHLCHVSRRAEILLIRAAKEKGIRVTCEVTPHHLFLSQGDAGRIGPGRSEVRPALATPTDVRALWENLDVIDCFATDHAPHTLAEKDGPNPPPGYPGLETALPLYLTAVAEGRLTLDELVARCVTNPRRIFGLPEQPETWLEIDPADRWEICARDTFTRCAWTPFEGRPVCGRLRRVVLRGQEAYRDGEIKVERGYGENIQEPPVLCRTGTGRTDIREP